MEKLFIIYRNSSITSLPKHYVKDKVTALHILDNLQRANSDSRVTYSISQEIEVLTSISEYNEFELKNKISKIRNKLTAEEISFLLRNAKQFE